MKAVPKPRRQRRGEIHCRGEGGGTHSSGRQFDRGERLRIEGGGKRGDDERIEDFIFFRGVGAELNGLFQTRSFQIVRLAGGRSLFFSSLFDKLSTFFFDWTSLGSISMSFSSSVGGAADINLTTVDRGKKGK